MAPDPALNGRDVAKAVAKRSEFDQNRPQVQLTLTAAGASRFEALTRELTGAFIAIVFDGRVQSSPKIMEPITGGQAWLSMGSGSDQELMWEAQRLARALQAPLPPLEVLRVEARCPR